MSPESTGASSPLPDVVTPESIKRFVFGEFRKRTLTKISEFTVPAGTPFETPEGLKAEDEECRVAFDAQGGVYPIRESIFLETYERATDAVTPDRAEEDPS